MNTRGLIHAMAAGLVLSALGCGESRPHEDGKIRVVATTSIIADTVRQIGGDRVDVETLMGPGIDPHRYSPTAGDLRKLASGRIIFCNGLHLEGKMTDVLDKPRPNQLAIAIGDKIAESRLRRIESGDGPHDPHIWMDPTIWADCVDRVADGLQETDPPHAEEYRARASEYKKRLAELHAANLATARAIPASARVLVTSHDAFEYFGAAYGFHVRGLQGVSTAAETSTHDVTELADFLGSRHVPAVFTETSVPSKGLEAVLDAVRMKYGYTVKLVGGSDALYSDALGPPGAPGDTLIGMLRHNMSVVANGLK